MDVRVVALCLVAQLYKPVHLDIQTKLTLNKYSFATEAGHWNYWLILMIIFVGAALPSSGCSSCYFMCNLAVRSLGHERHWCPRCSKCLWGRLAGESQNASLLHDITSRTVFKQIYLLFVFAGGAVMSCSTSSTTRPCADLKDNQRYFALTFDIVSFFIF